MFENWDVLLVGFTIGNLFGFLTGSFMAASIVRRKLTEKAEIVCDRFGCGCTELVYKNPGTIDLECVCGHGNWKHVTN